ncbi:scavenger receptor class F member 1 [Spea bombifrons]|uniref:scavenger receptor class F member 1 n=1 Tax=Spea bombifrons TaxID=233779 RepID=UPI002349438D|nr:scavenger receptor class F member 1 [Spea bombifrons]
MPRTMRKLQLLAFLWTWLQGIASELDPNGANVCKSESVTKELMCCPGWKQEGRACTTAICEGEDACEGDEVCIRPGVCRCKPGFFGASCTSRCPNQYWGSDCKQSCACFPFGKCDPVSGQCTCNPNRWGPNCEYPCYCAQQGTCNQLTGACECDPGWWAPHCNKMCHCNLQNSRCSHTTGRCICDSGYWGQRCGMKCNCNKSPCSQATGKCECREGWWGASCEYQCNCLYGKCNALSGECDCYPGYQGKNCADPCIPGTYGPRCKKRCGRCKQGEACSSVEGLCVSCGPGWNGTRCDQPCRPGNYGENCSQKCPKCRGDEVCNAETGTCQNCDAGKMGPRCEETCPPGRYGERCQFLCPVCIHGSCDTVTGDCVCDMGFWKNSCNETCPHGLFGSNCTGICNCSGGPCNPIYGTCQWTSSQKGAIIAGALIPLSLLFILCCCCCCGNSQSESKDRVNDGEGGSLSRMKHNFQGALASISSVLPCCSVGNSKFSWVTVSHHDTELPFNHSFIESPSTGWLSENSFSSFESDEGGPVYCVPPREGMSVADMDGCQEMSSKCNVFPDALTLNSEDASHLFSIPRTSSIAKAKRPSVSFAEGTKFECRRPSTTETPNLARKPKLASSLLKLPSIQSHAIKGGELQQCDQTHENTNTSQEPEDHPKLQRTMPVGRRRTMSNAHKVALKSEMTEPALNENIYEMKRKIPSVTTVYVSVGPPRKLGKPRRKSESNLDGAVQAVLKRLGSFQKGIPKPARKSLLHSPNFRPSQTKISCEEDIKNEDSTMECPNTTSRGNATKKPLIPTSAILKTIVKEGEGDPVRGGSTGNLENMYSTLTEPVILEQNLNEEHIYQRPEGIADSEPKYENVSIPNSFVNNEAHPLYEDAQMNGESSDT